MIGGSLEYLLCSLPYLTFEDSDQAKQRVLDLFDQYGGQAAGVLGPVEILEREAQKFLSAPAFDLFEKISLENIHHVTMQKSRSRILSAFARCTSELKREIGEWRKAARRGDKQALPRSLAGQIGTGTPLEKEVRIMKHQWDMLEELSAGHFSDLDALITYKIKLMLLLRWWSFGAAQGMERFIRTTQTTAYGR